MISLLGLSIGLAEPKVENQTGIWFSSSNIEMRTQSHVQYKESKWKSSVLFTHRIWTDKTQLWELRPVELRRKSKWKNISFEIGQLIPRWGQLDVLSVVDIIGGKDLRMGPTISPKDMRLGVLGAQISQKHAGWKWEIIVLPFSSQDTVQTIGPSWSLLKPQDIQDLFAATQTWSGDLLTEAWLKETLLAISEGLTPTNLLRLSTPLASPPPLAQLALLDPVPTLALVPRPRVEPRGQ